MPKVFIFCPCVPCTEDIKPKQAKYVGAHCIVCKYFPDYNRSYELRDRGHVTCNIIFNSQFLCFIWHWCYHPHTLRDSVSKYADLQNVATGSTEVDEICRLWGIWAALITNSRVPRMGKFIRELFSPFNSHGFYHGETVNCFKSAILSQFLAIWIPLCFF